MRPKISFPVEEGFIRLQPSIAAEIGMEAAIVLLYLIFILEGNTKYLIWDTETNSYWLKKSYNAMTADLYPYFKISISENVKLDEISQQTVSFNSVKHRIRIILKFLCEDLELISRKTLNGNGNAGREYYYSLNYKMLCLLNGLSVKWDHNPDLLRLDKFEKNRVRDVRQSHTKTVCAVPHTTAHPDSCAKNADSCATGRTPNTEYRKKKLKTEKEGEIYEFSELKIEKPQDSELSPEARQLLEEINAL